MLILAEFNRAYAVDDQFAPIHPEYFWVLSGNLKDFKLAPIIYTESFNAPYVTVDFNGVQHDFPASWYIVVVDEVTKAIDVVQFAECAQQQNLAFIHCSASSKFGLAQLKIVGMSMTPKEFVYPAIPNGCMMVTPILSDINDPNVLSVIIGANDIYEKHLEGLTASELCYGDPA